MKKEPAKQVVTDITTINNTSPTSQTKNSHQIYRERARLPSAGQQWLNNANAAQLNKNIDYCSSQRVHNNDGSDASSNLFTVTSNGKKNSLIEITVEVEIVDLKVEIDLVSADSLLSDQMCYNHSKAAVIQSSKLNIQEMKFS